MLYKRVLGRKCKKAPRENPPNGDFFVFSHAKRKYATFHALRFRLLFVVSLPGGAKGRHAKTRKNHHLVGFRVATFRVFVSNTRLYDMAQISHHSLHVLEGKVITIINIIYYFKKPFKSLHIKECIHALCKCKELLDDFVHRIRHRHLEQFNLFA